MAQSQRQRPFSTPLVRIAFLILFLSFFLASLYAEIYTETGVLSIRSRIPSSHTTADHYFANKRNLFNQYFVKRGWGWTTVGTLAYLVVAQLDTISKDGKTMNKVGLNVIESGRKLIIATMYWFYLTQATWFVIGAGPSIYQYVLTASGGKCMDYATGIAHEGGECRGPGLYFANGHDVSGHVFLLTYASLLLLTVISRSLPFLYNSIFHRSSKNISSDRLLSIPHTVVTSLVVVLTLLWEWMLIMTCLYFHTPLEKLTGFAFATLGYYLIG